ncbi:MAG: hypothetical protein K0R69_2097, partial [Clostridia bacterium]|nr:hypothetical protein [Clostridia bacterium]
MKKLLLFSTSLSLFLMLAGTVSAQT